jgi:hypothetical protein
LELELETLEIVTDHTVTLSSPMLSSNLEAVFSEEVSLALQEDSDVDEDSSLRNPADSDSEYSIVVAPLLLPI